METYEEKSLKLKIESHDVDLEIEKLKKELDEVGNLIRILDLIIFHQKFFTSTLTGPV